MWGLGSFEWSFVTLLAFCAMDFRVPRNSWASERFVLQNVSWRFVD